MSATSVALDITPFFRRLRKPERKASLVEKVLTHTSATILSEVVEEWLRTFFVLYPLQFLENIRYLIGAMRVHGHNMVATYKRNGKAHPVFILFFRFSFFNYPLRGRDLKDLYDLCDFCSKSIRSRIGCRLEIIQIIQIIHIISAPDIICGNGSINIHQ